MPRRPSFARLRKERSKANTGDFARDMTDVGKVEGARNDGAEQDSPRRRNKSANDLEAVSANESPHLKDIRAKPPPPSPKRKGDVPAQAQETQSPNHADPVALTSLCASYPVAPQQLIAPQVATRFVPVNEACDELWQCADPTQAASWLRHLHKAFLCTRLDAYDPSEAFVSLSGAALRFHGTSLPTMREDETPSSGSVDPETLWCVWEEALWAAAALARVCVGAAWRSQLRRRRAYIMGRGTLDDSISGISGGTANSSPAMTAAETKDMNDFSPLEAVVAAEMTSSHRSFSPMTASLFGNSRADSFFPPIQERLPAAMLRFAASAIEAAVPPLGEFGEESEQKWRERRKSLAEAQRELVLALCYATPEEAPIDDVDEQNQPHWTILEAHGPIGNMVCFWFASCGSGLSRKATASIHQESREESVDWACLLQITRAAADLVSAGWHPAVTRGVAEELTYVLLAVSERGLTLSDDDLTLDDELGMEGREERLAASLCAVEALSVLASIGSSGQIPTECQERVVRCLCDLQVATTLFGITCVLPAEEQTTPEMKALRMNQQSCHADMVDLLWVMLAHDSSAAIALETLLDMANASLTIQARNSHDQISEQDISTEQTMIEQSTIAIKTLGASLWGRPPDNPGIPDLRISWNLVLEALANTSHLLRSLLSSMTPDCLLYLLLNVISALRKFADSELLQGDALILVDEWKPFVRALRQGLDFWLDIRRASAEAGHQPVDPLCDQIRHETKLLVSRIGSFLNVCSCQEESSFHLIVESNDLRDLYISLLRNAVPRLDPAKGTELALSVVRSWATLGFSPHLSEEWVQTASEILKESFAVWLGSEARCVHSPLVRLEALLSITYDKDECSLVLPKDTWTPAVSPLVLTRYERDQHIALVREVLPWVLRLFAKDATGLDLPIPSTVTISCPQAIPEENSTIRDAYDGNVTLRRFALCLIGRFVRSVTGEDHHQKLLLGMLQAVAIRKDLGYSDHAITCRNESTVEDPPDRILMSLEAINQLELTLVAPFRAMPYNHSSVQRIIGILCRIVEHGVNSDGSTKVSGHNTGVLQWSRVVSFASLLVLCRLRMSHDGRLQLVDRDGVLQHVRDPLMFHLCGEDDDIDEGYLTAPFIRVSMSRNDSVGSFGIGRTSTDLTTVSFGLITETVISALHNSQSKTAIDDAGDFESRFRATCHDALSSFALSGIEICVSDELTQCLLSTSEASDYAEVERLAQCRALSFVSQRYVVRSFAYDDKDEMQDKGGPNLQTLEAFVGHLIRFCSSGRELEVLTGCRAIGAILYQLSRIGPADDENSILSRVSFQIVQRLKEEIAAKHVKDGISEDETTLDTIGDSLFSLVYSILAQPYYAATAAAQTTRALVAEVCLDFKGPYVLLSKAWRPLPIRCLSTALRRMSDSDLENMQAANTLGEDHRSSLMKDLVAQRRLQIRVLASNCSQGPHCLTRHEKMTRENDDIARFVVENEPKGAATPNATWLCGQSILTCRIGGSKSRYRGWLEVVVRSPTARSRRMIRLPNSVSLENPEFPSSLWTGRVNSTGTATKPPTTDRSHLTVPSDLYSDDTPVINRARKLIERWDAAYGPLPAPPPKREEAFYQSVIPTDPMQPTKDQSADATADEGGKSIRQWLTAALKGNSLFIGEVEQHFLSLGFSRELLGRDGTSLRPSGKSDFPDYLLPIQRLQDGPNVSRAVSILDRTSFLNTHKIALLFAGEAKKSTSKSESTLEHVILSAKGASPAFFSFAREIGSMVMTRHLRYYSGGLDTSEDSDGKFTFIYLDSVDGNDPATTMVVYHCVALMPENINNRKRHVGNDNIHIVFVEKGSRLHGLIHGEGLDCETLSSSLVSGQFGFLTIFVLAMPDEGLLRVSVRLRKGLPGDSAVFLRQYVGDAMISRSAAPDYVRDIAIRADITCKSILEEHFGAPNWTERKRHISSMKRYCAHQSF